MGMRNRLYILLLLILLLGCDGVITQRNTKNGYLRDIQYLNVINSKKMFITHDAHIVKVWNSLGEFITEQAYEHIEDVKIFHDQVYILTSANIYMLNVDNLENVEIVHSQNDLNFKKFDVNERYIVVINNRGLISFYNYGGNLIKQISLDFDVNSLRAHKAMSNMSYEILVFQDDPWIKNNKCVILEENNIFFKDINDIIYESHFTPDYVYFLTKSDYHGNGVKSYLVSVKLSNMQKKKTMIPGDYVDSYLRNDDLYILSRTELFVWNNNQFEKTSITGSNFQKLVINENDIYMTEQIKTNKYYYGFYDYYRYRESLNKEILIKREKSAYQFNICNKNIVAIGVGGNRQIKIWDNNGKMIKQIGKRKIELFFNDFIYYFKRSENPFIVFYQ